MASARDNRLACQLGLEDDDLRKEFDDQAMRAELREMLRQAEADPETSKLPPELAENIDRIGNLVGLSASDRMILAFDVLVQTEPTLSTALHPSEN